MIGVVSIMDVSLLVHSVPSSDQGQVSHLGHNINILEL